MSEQTHTPIEQDQKPYVGDEPQDAKLPPLNDPPVGLPLKEGTVEEAQRFEEQRVKDLDAEREEHNRRTAGGDPEP